MQDIGYVEVETASLDDVVRGLQDDLTNMRAVMNDMRGDVADLRYSWESAECDAFEEEFFENSNHLFRSLEALHKVARALKQTTNYYLELEQRLDEERVNL
jgi:uncharacterized protein YukE